jgi:hypothetical protein
VFSGSGRELSTTASKRKRVFGRRSSRRLVTGQKGHYRFRREALAEAAGTSARRVMLATVHQHDAPICDLTAQRLLDQHGLKGWNCDPVFHETAVQRTAAALKQALKSARGLGARH